MSMGLALARFAVAACATALALPAGASVRVVVHSVDPPGVGLNDPTPAAPVGGNSGTTLGEQRRILLQFAADLWGATLTSDVDIVLQATFAPLPCNRFGAILGSAGSIRILADFPNSPRAATWYPSALANRIAGVDLAPGPQDPGFLEPPFNDDLFAVFNGAIGTDPNCLAGLGWYYGLDDDTGGLLDLLEVVVHELAHGLGFQDFVNELDGSSPLGLDDVFGTFTLDTFLGRHWSDLAPIQRVRSATRTGELVWDGPHVRAQAPYELDRRPSVRVLAPASISGEIEVQPAAYGPPVDAVGVSGRVVLADDGSGTATDACQPLVGNYTGAIVLIDRGSCSFTSKTAAAEAVGARGVIVANQTPDGFPPMGGDDSTIGIPSVGILQSDGQRLRDAIPGVEAEIRLSERLLQGANADGNIRLYAPRPLEPGSSVAHWDTVATPDLLMEPFLDGEASPVESVDLTSRLLADIGWDTCPDSDFGETVVVGRCDSGVGNRVLDSGCTIADLVRGCAGASTPGRFVRCVANQTGALKRRGVIDGVEQGKIVACAAHGRRAPERAPGSAASR